MDDRRISDCSGKHKEAIRAALPEQGKLVARVAGWYGGHTVVEPLVPYILPVGMALYAATPSRPESACDREPEATPLHCSPASEQVRFYKCTAVGMLPDDGAHPRNRYVRAQQLDERDERLAALEAAARAVAFARTDTAMWEAMTPLRAALVKRTEKGERNDNA